MNDAAIASVVCVGGRRPFPGAADSAAIWRDSRRASRRVWLAGVEAGLLVRQPPIFPAVPTSKAVGRLPLQVRLQAGFATVRLPAHGMASAPASLRAVGRPCRASGYEDFGSVTTMIFRRRTERSFFRADLRQLPNNCGKLF